MVFIVQRAFYQCFMLHKNGAAVTFALESANVVGYNTLDTGFASQMLGVPFKGVGNNYDGVKLSDINGEFVSYDEIQISYMEDGLINFNTYQFLTEEDGVEAAGWYDGSWEPAADCIIPRGSAVWFVSSSGDAKGVTVAGEVTKGSTTHPAFEESSNMICSAYPVAFNPNATTVTWAGLQPYDEIQVSYMEDGLINFNTYQYLTEEDGVEKNGWYNGSWELVEEPIASVGEGFWLIVSDYANVTLTEKSPIAE